MFVARIVPFFIFDNLLYPMKAPTQVNAVNADTPAMMTIVILLMSPIQR